MTSGMVFRCEMRHFSRPSRSSGVDRQFSEPSMTKSSLPSRAPAQGISAMRGFTLVDFLQPAS